MQITDLAAFAFRHSDGKEQFDQVMAAVRASPELVALGRDGRDQERFISCDMIATEARLEKAGDELSRCGDYGVSDGSGPTRWRRPRGGGLRRPASSATPSTISPGATGWHRSRGFRQHRGGQSDRHR